MVQCGHNKKGVIRMVRVGIRYLKDHLSEQLVRVRSGEVVEVTDHGVPIARLTPLPKSPTAGLYALAERLGNDWQGGKPTGLNIERAPLISAKLSLSRAISEDRE